MSAQKQEFSFEVLEQRAKVEKEYIKLQGLIDKESTKDSFLWCPDTNHVYITDDIFRIREDDDENEDSIRVAFEVEGSQSSQSSVPVNTVILEVDGSQSPPSFVPENSIVPGVQNTPEVEVVPGSQNSQKQRYLKAPLMFRGYKPLNM
jgi:hypothetical protein